MTGQRQNEKNTTRKTGSRNEGTNFHPRTAAVFLDRDGTITKEVGYVNHVSRAQLFPWAGKAIRMFKSAGLPVVVLTNQSGVGRGYFTEELVAQVHQKIQGELAAQGTEIDAYYYCPHHPSAVLQAYRQDCRCRKPSTGMADDAAERFGIDLTASYVVGDTYRDMQMGFNIGARTILLMTGYGRGEFEHHRNRWQRAPDLIAENLLEAAGRILQELNVSANDRAVSGSVLP